MRFKPIVKRIAPPVLVDAVRFLRQSLSPRTVEWEYVPEGWAAESRDAEIKGWNVESVLEARKSRWQEFVESTEARTPFGVSPEAVTPQQTNVVFHNIMMTYGYVLALVSRQRTLISMLDWGGSLGHYYLISKALVPDLEIEYHCMDLPQVVEYGRTLFPNAHFSSDDTCLIRQYDFVFVSTSLHYVEDWRSLLERLARATAGYLFVTRLPVVQKASSFVFVQRPYSYGYKTEYLGWCLNRAEFLDFAGRLGLELVREFVTGEEPVIYHAPEQCHYWGFLFRPTTQGK